MTRTPFDAFSKQLLEEILTPLGRVETTHEVPGESRFVDVYFVPAAQVSINPNTPSLLSRIAATPCLIEPFRNQPTLTEVRNCLLKLFSVQAEAQRQARRDEERLPEAQLPQLWILVPSASEALLNGFGAKPDAAWPPGVYFLSEALKVAIIAIHQLPSTEETRWLRLLGRGTTQQQAINEVLALPADDPRRVNVLQLLVNWKISLEVTGEIEQEEQSLMATLSQAYLEWEQQTRQQGVEQGERSLILRQLTRRVEELPAPIRLQIETLSIDQLELLGEALLDFSSLSDLEAWLAQQER